MKSSFKLIIITILILMCTVISQSNFFDMDEYITHKVNIRLNSTINVIVIKTDYLISSKVGKICKLIKCINENKINKYLEHIKYIWSDFKINIINETAFEKIDFQFKWINLYCTEDYWLIYKNFTFKNELVGGAWGDNGQMLFNLKAGDKNIAHEFGHSIGLSHAHYSKYRSVYFDNNIHNLGDLQTQNHDILYNPLSLMYYGVIDLKLPKTIVILNNINVTIDSLLIPKSIEILFIMNFIGKFVTHRDLIHILKSSGYIFSVWKCLNLIGLEKTLNCIYTTNPSLTFNWNSWVILTKGDKSISYPELGLRHINRKTWEIDGWSFNRTVNLKPLRESSNFNCFVGVKRIKLLEFKNMFKIINEYESPIMTSGYFIKFKCLTDNFLEVIQTCCKNFVCNQYSKLIINDLCIMN